MPVGPHPISLTLYDTDNTTLKQGAKFYCRNVTKRSTGAKQTTDANGLATFDLANLPLGDGQTEEYEIGDVILIIAFNGEDSSAARYVVAGASKAQTLYLNPLRHDTEITKEVIKSLVCANTGGSGYYAKIYSLNDGRVLIHVEVLAGDTIPVPTELRCPGGIVLEREHQDLVVTGVIK